MTRKDYVLIAEGFKNAFSAFTELSYSERWGMVKAARSVADTLAADNPRFDRERFLKACGVTP